MLFIDLFHAFGPLKNPSEHKIDKFSKGVSQTVNILNQAFSSCGLPGVTTQLTPPADASRALSSTEVVGAAAPAAPAGEVCGGDMDEGIMQTFLSFFFRFFPDFWGELEGLGDFGGFLGMFLEGFLNEVHGRSRFSPRYSS